jgi:hypothetical protein
MSVVVSPDELHRRRDRHGSLNFFDSVARRAVRRFGHRYTFLRFGLQPRWNAVGKLGIAGDPQRVSGDTSVQLLTSQLGDPLVPCSPAMEAIHCGCGLQPGRTEVATGGNDDRVILHDAMSGSRSVSRSRLRHR